MSDLDFRVTGARPEPHAAVPTLVFDLRVDGATALHHIALGCQIRLEPQRREYSAAEEGKLTELFGSTDRWHQTVRPILWGHASLMIAHGDDCGPIGLPVACTYDFEVTATKYLHSLDDGEIPFLFFFSGTVFVRSPEGLRASRIAWDREARYRLPVSVWRTLMDHYYPGGGWLRLQRETLDALLRYKARRALPTWDGVLQTLLSEAGS